VARPLGSQRSGENLLKVVVESEQNQAGTNFQRVFKVLKKHCKQLDQMQDRQAGGRTTGLVFLAGMEVQVYISAPVRIVICQAMAEACCPGQLPKELRTRKQHGVGGTIHAEAGVFKILESQLVYFVLH
jgi:hypothetical protein